MARSTRDTHGKRINGEIVGRGTARVVDGRMIVEAGGEEVGSALRKREAKHRVSRLRRLDDQRILRAAKAE